MTDRSLTRDRGTLGRRVDGGASTSPFACVRPQADVVRGDTAPRGTSFSAEWPGDGLAQASGNDTPPGGGRQPLQPNTFGHANLDSGTSYAPPTRGTAQPDYENPASSGSRDEGTPATAPCGAGTPPARETPREPGSDRMEGVEDRQPPEPSVGASYTRAPMGDERPRVY